MYLLKQLIINFKNHLQVVSQIDILYLKADGGYTSIILNNGQEISSCKTLTVTMKELDPDIFLRISQSYVVNKRFIVEIHKKDKHVLLINGSRLHYTVALNQMLNLIGSKAGVIAGFIMLGIK